MNSNKDFEKIILDKVAQCNDNPTLSELEAKLENELSKPEAEIDFGLVDELTLSIIEFNDYTPINNNTKEKLKELKRLQNARKKRFKMPRWAVGLSVACFLLLFGNVCTVAAWNVDLFSFIVELTKGGVVIDFSRNDDSETLPVFDTDPYSIKDKCAEMNISVELPHYLPDGFSLANMECDSSDCKYIGAVYKNGKQLINLNIESYEDSLVGIPSDSHNLTEFNINGRSAVMSREDNQMIMIFRSEDYLITIMTIDVDYAECDKILKSIS